MKLRLICDRCGGVETIELEEGETWPLDPYDERVRALSRECPEGGRAFCEYRVPSIEGVARRDERDE